jgi:hypothetical protein
MFVKHIIKTLHVSVTIVWPSSGARLSCLVLLLHSVFVCVVKFFIWYVAVCCQCMCACVRAWCTCLWDVWFYSNTIRTTKETLIRCQEDFLYFVDHESRYNRVKKNQLDVQLILSVFRQHAHVSGVSRPIIKRYNRMYTTIGTHYSFYMIVCCPISVPIQPGQQTVI